MQNQIPWWLQQSSGVGEILLIEWMKNDKHVFTLLFRNQCTYCGSDIETSFMPIGKYKYALIIDVNWIGSFQEYCVPSFYFRLALESAVG